MFTKKDFYDYFYQISLLEKEALRQQAALAVQIKNPVLRQALQPVITDEARHVSLAERLLEIADKQ